MNERITLVSLFDEKDIEKITQYTNLIKEEICKVPYQKTLIE